MQLTISPLKEPKTVNSINFGASGMFSKTPNLVVDKFEACLPKSLYNPKFEETIDKIFAKVEKATNTFTPEILESVITNLKTTFPQRSEKEILSVLQRLSQWANYPSLEVIGNFIKKENIKNSVSLEGINPLMTYFQVSKGILPYNFASQYPVYFVTKDILHQALNFSQYLDSSLKKMKFVNLEGFEDGVNLFTDDRKLESSAKKALMFIEKKSHMGFSQALDAYLNGRIISKFKNTGVDLITLTRPSVNPNRRTILEQMSPYKPNKNDIRTTLQKIGFYYADTPAEYHFLTNNIAKYFEAKLNVYTKQFLIDGLNQLNVLIKNFAKDNNIDKKNIYYVIPKESQGFKSFDVITYMYKKQFNIPDSQIIKVPDIRLLDEYKDKSAFVILDDFVGSGDCYTSIANYNSSNVYLNSKNIHLLYCPIIGYEQGLVHIARNNILKGREGLDFILIPEKNIIKENQVNRAYANLADDVTGRFIAGFEGYQFGQSCNVFPYMTPDNNTDLASFITKFFFPGTEPIKNCHEDLHRITGLKLSDLIDLYSKLK